MMATVLHCILFLTLLFCKNSHSICGYQGCNLGKEGYLNVHLIAHTHDDVGWLKTVDEYYYGSNSYIQRAGVQYILDSVVQALAANPERRFTYVEMAFFTRWWRVQPTNIQEMVKQLVASGQLQFALGAWSMADEATVYYADAIDSMTEGNDLLKTLFGDCGIPRVGWQIDPFGHSRDHAELFSDSGFDGLFFQRMDYREKDKRRSHDDPQLEVLWDTATSMINTSQSLFTSMLYGSYCYPRSFCFDDKCSDPPMQDDIRLKGYNIPSRVNSFLDYINTISPSFATNHVLVPMGCDFTYENANMNFKNSDKLMRYVNARQLNGSKVNLLYSTPQCYTKAVNGAFWKRNHISRRGGDFFPYATDGDTYWTGFYASRPALKGYVRKLSSELSYCEQVHLFANRLRPTSNSGEVILADESLDELRQVMGVLQHHDAVTGTEKQQVAYDYLQSMSSAADSCKSIISDATFKLVPHLREITTADKLTFCDLLNISVCTATEEWKPYIGQSGEGGVYIFLYNPNGWEAWSTWLRIPVNIPVYAENDVVVILRDLRSSEQLGYQLVPITRRTIDIPERSELYPKANMELVFNAAAAGPPEPPTGTVAFYLGLTNFTQNQRLGTESRRSSQHECSGISLFSQTTKLYFKMDYLAVNPLTIVAEHIFSGMKMELSVELMYYLGETNQYRNSGAYVFRPAAGTKAKRFPKPSVQTVNGSCVQEVHLEYTPWATLVVRLYANGQLETEWTVGSIPDNAATVGREVIVRYTVKGDAIMPNYPGEFFTDSAGRRLIRRVRNERIDWNLPMSFVESQPISGNYYPVVNRIMLKGRSPATNPGPAMAFAVYTDRAQGGSSLEDGQIELMVHRRCVRDDGFGVGEKLMEDGVDQNGLIVRGVHQLRLDELKIVEQEDPQMSRLVSKQPTATFLPAKSLPSSNYTNPLTKDNFIWNALNQALPPEIHLLTLTSWPLRRSTKEQNERSRILLRLEHINPWQQHSESEPVALELSNLFRGITITSYKEVTLTATQEKSAAVASRLNWPTESVEPYNDSGHVDGTTGSVSLSLHPGKIYTYLLDYW